MNGMWDTVQDSILYTQRIKLNTAGSRKSLKDKQRINIFKFAFKNMPIWWLYERSFTTIQTKTSLVKI